VKAHDVVRALAANVPLYTDAFSESVGISDVTVAGTTATVTTDAPHQLEGGQDVAISGAEAPVQIDVASFARTGSSATFETLQDHDLTLSERDKLAGGKTVTLTSADQPEFNGTFALLRVVNRRKIVIAVADSGPVAMTGPALLANANGGLFNGLFAATNVTATTFDYELPRAYPLPPVFTGARVQTYIRALSVLDFDSYLRDVYTSKTPQDGTLVVQLGDVTQSKDRDEQTDAASTTSGEQAFNPVLIQPFAVYIVLDVTDDLTGAEARDRVESEYIPAIFRSILRRAFDTGFTASSWRATFTGHGVYAYADPDSHGRAVYAHEVAFEQAAQLCGLDAVGPADSVAMRDVDFALTTSLGTGELTADVDLDEEPLT